MRENVVVTRWAKVSKQLKDLKKIESSLRDKVVDYFFDRTGTGTASVDVRIDDHDCKLAVTRSVSWHIDTDTLKELSSSLDRAMVKKLVRVKYELNKKAYDELNPEQRAVFNQCLVSKPNKPQLKLKKIESE